MPRFDLNRLGSAEFESLAQSLLKAVIGEGVTIFGPGPDGAREATFEGTANSYPSEREPWSGRWLFQAKYHDLERVSPEQARKTLLKELENELDKAVNKYRLRFDHYILITNVPFTGVRFTGARDIVDDKIAPKYPRIKNIHVWAFDDLVQFLAIHANVRTAYLHLITPGDILGQLYDSSRGVHERLVTTVRSYVSTALARDSEAQLDQAGEVGEQPIRLERIFIDINSTVAYPRSWRDEDNNPYVHAVDYLASEGLDVDDEFSTLRLLLSDEFPRVVLIGGPGEGKSTIGQYLAQLHRATLVQRTSRLDPKLQFVPVTPRLPFRVLLKEYGQWVTEQPVEKRALEHFLAADVTSLSSRACAAEDIHELISSNPVLVILDGLDEVTERDVRTTMLNLLDEFQARCNDVLGGDIQILATSRPTSYSGQFDQEQFLHLTVRGLTRPQIHDYVEKWTTARNLDRGKARRLREIMAACVADSQVSVLTNTPLQVTILILVILASGNPPKQREALFAEYLEVIYRRERAKAPRILETEKRLLFGLHEYIGYLLQKQSATTQNVSAELGRTAYEQAVREYLLYFDPYQPREDLDAAVDRITREAGQRFVLLVEVAPDKWGFELRSIQEFFAAAHLADSAETSAERFERFEAISTSPHWRNVALFFAGRVGRKFPGEAPNVIEVCRAIDRVGVDIHLRRGALLALELAADRAFDPNARLQYSSIEYGLQVLDSSLAFPAQRANSIATYLKSLSNRDLEGCALPLLRLKLSELAVDRLWSVVEVMHDLGVNRDELAKGLQRIIASSSPQDGVTAVVAAIRYGIDPSVCAAWLGPVSRSVSVPDAVVGLARIDLDINLRSAGAIAQADLDDELIDALCRRQFRIQFGRVNRPVLLDESLDDTFPLAEGNWRSQYYQYVSALDNLSEVSRLSNPVTQRRASSTSPLVDDFDGSAASYLPVILKPPAPDFHIPQTPVSGYLAATLWGLHLSVADVTVESATMFSEFVWTVIDSQDVRQLVLSTLQEIVEPLRGLSSDEVWSTDVVEYIAKYTGSRGAKRWRETWTSVDRSLFATESDRREFQRYGLHAPISTELRPALTSLLESAFGEQAEALAYTLIAQRPSSPRSLNLPAEVFSSISTSIAEAVIAASTVEELLRHVVLARLLSHEHTAASTHPLVAEARDTLAIALSDLEVRNLATVSGVDVLAGLAIQSLAVGCAPGNEGRLLNGLSRHWEPDQFVHTAPLSPSLDVSEALKAVAVLALDGREEARKSAALLFPVLIDSIARTHGFASSDLVLDADCARVADFWRSEDPIKRTVGFAALRLLRGSDPLIMRDLCEAYGRATQLNRRDRMRYRAALGGVIDRSAASDGSWCDEMSALLASPSVPRELKSTIAGRLGRVVAASSFDIRREEAHLHLPLRQV